MHPLWITTDEGRQASRYPCGGYLLNKQGRS